ncbi:MAG: hypothetical protein JW720_02455 [Sedimentisphaerales bacterium]|nr:hypothetical protein [Sedimentisphaerales bacterium]
MESPAGSLLTEAVEMPSVLGVGVNVDAGSDAKQIQAAKDFESVLITKLLDAMESTIGDWGLEKDPTNKQVHSIFSMYLGRHIGENGGFGLWKGIYESLSGKLAESSTVDSAG